MESPPPDQPPATPPSPDGLPRDSGDLGLGRVVSDESRQRMLRPDGSFNVRRTGMGVFRSHRIYHDLVSMSWPAFVAVLALVYAAVGAAFAVAFWALGPDALDAPPGDAGGAGFFRALYFSVQTFATIGYGRIAPVSHGAQALVTAEAFVGIFYAALATGLTFARVARPDADIVFSRRLLVAPYQGGQALMFRLANARRSELSDVSVEVTFSVLVDDPAVGRRVRRYAALDLERRHVTFFPLTWTVVHPLVPGSPVWGCTDADLRDGDAEILVRLSALDEATMQSVVARTSYRAGDGDVLWHARFRDLFDRSGDVLTVDVSRLDETDPAEPSGQASTASAGSRSDVSTSV
ncbi:MAG TPA: ion channel [Rubricoccaceae bacterium]